MFKEKIPWFLYMLMSPPETRIKMRWFKMSLRPITPTPRSVHDRRGVSVCEWLFGEDFLLYLIVIIIIIIPVTTETVLTMDCTV